MTDTPNADFLALTECLQGRPAASLMNSEQINKVIKAKQSDTEVDFEVPIINLFLKDDDGDRKKQKGLAQ